MHSHRQLLQRLALLTALLSIPAAPVVVAETRPAQVAGQFYPQERAELRRLVQDLLEGQPSPSLSRKPRILIVPHAGYQYSGPVAGRAFREAQGHSYDGVVVVGFTHRGQFAGASVDDREAYETPLGTLRVNLDAVRFLQAQQPLLRTREEAHASGEHSLEVMLPFIQVALGNVPLVPILMGSASLEDAEALAQALAALAGRGDYLFVFSTDLSHYHPDEDARRRDEVTVNAILGETPRPSVGSLKKACWRPAAVDPSS